MAQTAQSNQDEVEWNRIRTTKSDAELVAFIQRYPDSKYASFASRRIDELEWEIEPSAHLRLVRMRGKSAPERDELLAGDAWRASQDLLARTSAAPQLSLTAGNA